MKVSKLYDHQGFTLLSPPKDCEVLQTYIQAREKARPSMKSTGANTSMASLTDNHGDVLMKQIIDKVHNEAVSNMLL